MSEQKLREQIAQDIERRLIWDKAPIEIRRAINKTAEQAAMIARGKPEVNHENT